MVEPVAYGQLADGKEVSEIKVGQSGADVYEIDKKAILKHVVRQNLKNDMFDTYSREALFYKEKMRDTPRYLPDILAVEISNDEIVILMKKYARPDRTRIDKDMIRKVAKLLADIHSDKIPEFMKEDNKKIESLTKERIEYCLVGWKSVLEEHPNVFNETFLDAIADNINNIIEWHNNEERLLSHGDFHWDNILINEDDRLLICDWQGICISGESSDISFFMSRLGADGIGIDEHLFIKSYSEAIQEITGRIVNADNILRHIAASNIITTFEFWHDFLHGNDEDRVKGIYDKMIEDYHKWMPGI